MLEGHFSKPLEKAIINAIQEDWNSYKDFFRGIKSEEIESDLFARSLWSISYNWALNQSEEYFCDLFGLRLFGEGFPNAFAYLLAPFQKSQRAPHYPSLADRGCSIASTARLWGIPIRDSYGELFGELPAFDEDKEVENKLLLLADRVSKNNVPEIVSRVVLILHTALNAQQAEDLVSNCIKRFSYRAPAERAGGIANIITAAWRIRIDPQLIGLKQMNAEASTMLAEMVWKSIEINEIEYRQGVK